MDKNEISHPSLFGIRISACLEIFIFFSVTTLLSSLLDIPYNFFSLSLHPFWIIVILISAQYGTYEGFLAALVSSIVLLTGPLPVRNILYDRFEYFFFLAKLPILWFVSATLVGEITMRHIRELVRLRKAVQETESREKTVAESYESLKKIKERLEMKVSSDMQTTLSLLESFLELEADENEIIQGALHLIQTLIAPEKFSIFLLQDGALTLIASEGWTEQDFFLKQIPPTHPLFAAVVIEQKTIQIKTDSAVLEEEGILATPIFDFHTHQVFGMIKVEQIPFLSLRLSNIESLRCIGKWIGTAFSKLKKGSI